MESYFNLDLSGHAVPLFHVFFVLLLEMTNGTLASLIAGDDRSFFDDDDEPNKFFGSLAAHVFWDVLLSHNDHVQALFLKDCSDLNGPTNHFFGDATLLHALIGVICDDAHGKAVARGVGVESHEFSFSRSGLRVKTGCEWILETM